MNTEKVIRRLAELSEAPEGLSQLARDIGFGVARGEREALAVVGRELAAAAPSRRQNEYWAGFAAALGTMLASYESAHERVDARQAALRAVRSDASRAVVCALACGPATGAELAEQIGITPSATSKILAALRGAGLARILGAEPLPKRGARKPHALTPLGSWAADTLIGDGASAMAQLSADG